MKYECLFRKPEVGVDLNVEKVNKCFKQAKGRIRDEYHPLMKYECLFRKPEVGVDLNLEKVNKCFKQAKGRISSLNEIRMFISFF
jgi:hypothetical protein